MSTSVTHPRIHSHQLTLYFSLAVIFSMSKEDRKDFYPIISRGLRRPVFAVYRRVQRDYDPNNHKGVYSPAELAKLHELLQVRRVLLLTTSPPLKESKI